jgi:hypothetical protein
MGRCKYTKTMAKQVDFRIGTIVLVYLQRPIQNNMIRVPYQAMYGRERVYQIKNNRLQAVSVKTIGEYKHETQTELLITSQQLNSGDAILTTHLPNALTGLKVDVITHTLNRSQ